MRLTALERVGGEAIQALWVQLRVEDECVELVSPPRRSPANTAQADWAESPDTLPSQNASLVAILALLT